MITLDQVDPAATYNVVHYCRAEIINEVRQASIAFFNSFYPEHATTIDRMLPTPLSPTGEEPATHYLCYMGGTPGDHLIAYIKYRDQTGLDTILDVVPDKQTFLADQGLKFITGVDPQ